MSVFSGFPVLSFGDITDKKGQTHTEAGVRVQRDDHHTWGRKTNGINKSTSNGNGRAEWNGMELHIRIICPIFTATHSSACRDPQNADSQPHLLLIQPQHSSTPFISSIHPIERDETDTDLLPITALQTIHVYLFLYFSLAVTP